ncbi:hypothetical protein BAD_0617 [Bifidobacterium adolescentis ATCC 15703]|uniref:Uncharacterized protein n=1 Tax=Bifidobacterium adolescentis (strain ATCC 15703 / DSM 20083 / NCTC 11814 / E194a) TaxID=367928 RepID=A1A115_BIFAA|nr:hypothetical protein BAD_0617 [Bifidobacterium adolescentis ATCC 15703]
MHRQERDAQHGSLSGDGADDVEQLRQHDRCDDGEQGGCCLGAETQFRQVGAAQGGRGHGCGIRHFVFSLIFVLFFRICGYVTYWPARRPTHRPTARCRPANRRRLGYWSLRNSGFPTESTRRRIVATCVDCVVRADATVRQDRPQDRSCNRNTPARRGACCSCLPQWSAGPVRRRTRRRNRLYGNPMAGIARLVRRRAVPTLPFRTVHGPRCRRVRRNVPACAVRDGGRNRPCAARCRRNAC